MRAALVGLLLCGMAMGQSKMRLFVDTADPAQPSTVNVTTYLAPSHGEQIRMLHQFCPDIQVTEDLSKADLVLRWESKTWQQTSWKGHQQEYTLYSPVKDVLGSGASHHIKNAAKDICKLIAATALPASPQHASR